VPSAGLAEAWDLQRLGEHGYSDDFKIIAKQLVGYFIESRAGFAKLLPSEMRLAVGGGEIIVRPDEVLTKDGQTHVRSVRTGHSTSKELETVAAAIFTLAAHGKFPGCTVEFVHLGDATTRGQTATVRQALRNSKSRSLVAAMKKLCWSRACCDRSAKTPRRSAREIGCRRPSRRPHLQDQDEIRFAANGDQNKRARNAGSHSKTMIVHRAAAFYFPAPGAT
jgi:hypothetical protein